MDNKLSINFNIARKNQKRSFLLLSATWKGNRIQVGSGISVLVKSWDKNKQRVKSSFIDSSKVNDKLANIESRLTEEFNKLYYNNKLNKQMFAEIIRGVIDEVVRGLKKHPEKTLLSAFRQMIDNRKSGKEVIERTGKYFSKAVIDSYESTFTHLSNYEKIKGKLLTFDNVDKVFYSDFVRYLINQGLTDNTVGKHIKILKVFMKWGFGKYHDNTSFFDFKVWKVDSDSIAITNDELKLFENIDLTDKRLSEARDLFVIQCLSGLRFSDVINLEATNFDLREGIIKIKAKKTKKTLFIPISERMFRIVSKYLDSGFPKPNNQNYNECLKKLGELVGLNQEIRTTKSIGNREIVEVKPKYEKLTSHVGRRSFITILMGSGVSHDKVMKISGHKTLSSFERYIKTPINEAINDVRNVLDNESKQKSTG